MSDRSEKMRERARERGRSTQSRTGSADLLDSPSERLRFRNPMSGDAFGRSAEWFARIMGTPGFLVGMTIFCAVWLGWNTFLPKEMQFDPRELNYTLLTLILSLQASYAAPLLLLAQNRQDDRDRVQAEQDRQQNERNHATTDFITREIASLRLGLADVATRDFVRGEFRDVMSEFAEHEAEEARRHAEPNDGSDAFGTVTMSVDDLRAVMREEIARALAQRPDAGAGVADGAASSHSAPRLAGGPEGASR